VVGPWTQVARVTVSHVTSWSGKCWILFPCVCLDHGRPTFFDKRPQLLLRVDSRATCVNITIIGVQRAFGMFRTGAAFAANNKLWDGAKCHRIVKSWFHHKLALVVPAYRKLLHHNQVGGRGAWTRVSKWKAIITGRRRTTWILWKEGVTPSDIRCRLFAICGEKALACSTLSNWVQSFSSGKQTAQSTVDGWYGNTCEAIRKLPRRWQRCLDAGG